jgi:hypothetical protein
VLQYAGRGSRNIGRREDQAGNRIAAQLQRPQIELDAIYWQSEWRDLTRHDPEELARRVTEAIQAEAWVVDGN